MEKNVHASEGRAIQPRELVKQLQAKVNLNENMVIDIFQEQSLEVCKKMELVKLILFDKVEIIQNHFWLVN
jgi:hypothetical protein